LAEQSLDSYAAGKANLVRSSTITRRKRRTIYAFDPLGQIVGIPDKWMVAMWGGLFRNGRIFPRCRATSSIPTPEQQNVVLVDAATLRKSCTADRILRSLQRGRRAGASVSTADEIAEPIVFLASDQSSFVYCANLAVDGGRTAV